MLEVLDTVQYQIHDCPSKMTAHLKNKLLIYSSCMQLECIRNLCFSPGLFTSVLSVY